MSLRRFNGIAAKLAKELISRIRGSYLTRTLPQQTLRILQNPAKGKAHVLSRNVFMRAFQRVLRNNRHFVRPFAALRYDYHDRARDEHSRRFAHLRFREKNNSSTFDRIRSLFGENARYNSSLNSNPYPDSLSGYEIGDYIACGCNAAIYELRVSSMSGFNQIPSATEGHPPGLLTRFPLALKIMFNYDFTKTERSLWMEMGEEIIPLQNVPKIALQGRMANFKPLPKRHPNIIKLHTAFVDVMPILKNADSLYPEALPNVHDYEQLNTEPKTLFVVMQRYHMTLRDYVLTRKRNYWKGRVMFGQLLEAIVYLYENKISHRDIKSDNVLLDFDNEDDIPHLVLSDFGSALATGSWHIKYERDDVDRGGNLCLMAPEIRRPQPGPGVELDFSMADTWSSGTLAYEIFTRRNPFYSQMSSETYEERQLPLLPKRIHHAVKSVAYDMLKIEPEERIKPAVAANVIAISLFRYGLDIRAFLQQCGFKLGLDVAELKQSFNETLNHLGKQLERKLEGMIELYAGETIISRLISPTVISKAELQLRATFLARLDHDEVWSAMKYFFVEQDSDGQSATMNGFLGPVPSTLPDTFSSAEM